MDMTQEKNKQKVLVNDKMEPKVPGILQDHTGVKKPQELRNQELYYRAIGR